MDCPEELRIKRDSIAQSLFSPEPVTAAYNVNHSSQKQKSVVAVAAVDHWNQEPKKPRPVIRMKYSKKPSTEEAHQPSSKAERKPENKEEAKTKLRSLDDLGLDEFFNATATKLEAVKRKIHESYDRSENAKKQRMIQVMELKDLPRGGKTGERIPNRFSNEEEAKTKTKTKLRSLDDLGLDEFFNATATKLEAVKRKIHESYERSENAKKQRRIQVMELKDLPRGGKTGGRIPIRFPGHRESLIKKINELKRRNSSRIHSYSMYKPVIV